jgi:cellulose synthase/poly-beta-1,6-N-acetylglucosamine synthase-like glycosyltransferase
VVFLDSDCVCHPTWLSELLKPFSDPTVAGVQGRYKNGVKHWMAEFIQLEIEERYERLQKSMAVKKSIDFVSTYSAAYRKRIFLENGGFDESFRTASGEDTDLSFRISANGHRLVFAPRAVVDHFHPASLLKYWRTKFYRAYWRVHLYRKNPDKIKNDSYTNPLIKFQIIFAGIFLATDFTAKIEFFLGTTAQAFLTGMVSAGALLALFLLSFPAAFFIFKKNWKLGIAAPFILTVNAFLFLLGCAYGLVRLRGLK